MTSTVATDDVVRLAKMAIAVAIVAALFALSLVEAVRREREQAKRENKTSESARR